MAHIQRLGALGIGLEATAETAVTPQYWLELSDAPSVKDTYEYENITTARGRVEASQGQKLMRTFGEGSAQILLDPVTSVLPFVMILGSGSTASAGGGLYDHTITINNTNTPKTATLVFDRVADTREFAGAVLEELTISVSDSFATLGMTFKSQESATGSASESYTTYNKFNFKELTAKFGTTVSNANSAEATPLSGVEMTITRGAKLTYQTGDNSPADISQETLEVNGNYSLLFEDATERDKYLNDTQNAMILTFTDADSNSIKITVPNVRLNNWEPSNDLDEIVSQTATFSGHYDDSEGESIRAVVTNDVSSYTNL